MELLNAFWFLLFYNFGDLLSPLILKFLSGSEVKNCEKETYGRIVSLGSLIGNGNKLYLNDYIYGTGCMYPYKIAKDKLLLFKNIFAVRGPKTREVLLLAGIKCPEIYGDPGIFAPLIFLNINKNLIYDYGIVLHHHDICFINKILKMLFNKNILIILATGLVLSVILSICLCKKIISSSLHGIIVAESYGIPAIWLEISGMVEGYGFKFYDYYLGSGRSECDVRKLNWRETISLEDILTIKKPIYDVLKFLDAAPFEIKPEIKTLCINYFKNLNK